MHLLIYTPRLTPRISYIFTFIFRELLKLDPEFSTEASFFATHPGAKLSYAPEPLGDELFFRQTPLLLNNRIEELSISTTTFGAQKVPFPVDGSALPFDVFAASFYFITRYEEYVHNRRGKGAFSSSISLQKKINILGRPVADEWAMLIKNLLRTRYPAINFGKKEFTHLPSVHGWLQPAKPVGLIARSGQLFKSLLKREQRHQLFDELTGLGHNQLANLEYLNNIFSKKHLTPFYFVGLSGESYTGEAVRIFISRLRTAANIGFLSPCPDSDSKRVISEMVTLFEELNIPNAPLTQQLEGLSMPGCYLQLLKGGVKADFSMGYQDICGFRAGTCTPFYWYDLQLERASDLMIYPYAVADNALRQHSVGDAEKIYKRLVDAVKMVNGTFCSSWALKSLTENIKFKKWRAFYESMLIYAD